MPIFPCCPDPILPSLIRTAQMEVPNIVLVDIGCSGGLAAHWNPYSEWLRGFGIDPFVNEIDLLKRQNTRSNVEYHAGSVVGPALPRVAPLYEGWFDRTSAMAAHQILDVDYQNQVYNSGLAPERSERKFTLDEFCSDRGLTRVDFIKSDTDGHEYGVFSGGQKTLSTVLGVLVEVMFCKLGDADAVFREVDAYLDQQGLYLVGMNPQSYTRAALPGRFNHSLLAETAEGAWAWADALYLRDFKKHGPHDLESALRFAMIAELFNLADVAAEALSAVQDQAPGQIQTLLDGLVRYSAQPDVASYQELMRRFQENPRMFVAGAPGAPEAKQAQLYEQLKAELERVRADCQCVREDYECLQRSYLHDQNELLAVRQELGRLHQQVWAMENSRGWRMLEKYRRLRDRFKKPAK